jgi:hypothetical protein
LVRAIELSHRRRRAEGPLRTGIMKAARALQPNRRSRNPGGDIRVLAR